MATGDPTTATTAPTAAMDTSSAMDASAAGAGANGATDIVTQLQTRLDELATQLYAALRYTSTHHPSTAPSALAATVISQPSQPSSFPGPTQSSASTQQQQQQQQPASPAHNPQPPDTFEADLQELAMDLVAKQVEIETLIQRLPPDLDAAQAAQERRIAELAAQLVAVEQRAAKVETRRERTLERVEAVIGRFGRA